MVTATGPRHHSLPAALLSFGPAHRFLIHHVRDVGFFFLLLLLFFLIKIFFNGNGRLVLSALSAGERRKRDPPGHCESQREHPEIPGRSEYCGAAALTPASTSNFAPGLLMLCPRSSQGQAVCLPARGPVPRP